MSSLKSSQLTTSRPPVCPLRRLAKGDSPSDVLREFSTRINDMPPDHVMLMQKFQQNGDVRKTLDERFGDDKAAMLLHLWETHRDKFRSLDDLGWRNTSENVERWLQSVNSDGGSECQGNAISEPSHQIERSSESPSTVLTDGPQAKITAIS